MKDMDEVSYRGKIQYGEGGKVLYFSFNLCDVNMPKTAKEWATLKKNLNKFLDNAARCSLNLSQ